MEKRAPFMACLPRLLRRARFCFSVITASSSVGEGGEGHDGA